MRASTVYVIISFFFRNVILPHGSVLTYIVVEKSKDITHVKLLPSLAAKISDICDGNVNTL